MTDIHGNSPALKAVLKDIDKRNIDHIYSLGDMLAIGPDSNEVLELLTSRNNISYVAGNHDLAVLAAIKGEEPPKGHENERHHHEWLASRLSAKFVGFLEQLPMKLEQTIHNNRLLFVHYHLNNENQFMSIDTNPNTDSLDKHYEGADYNLVCFGHHHIIHDFQSHRRYYNPGALGCNDKPLARYGIIEITNTSISIESIEVPYDNTNFLKSFEELKVPEREFILKVFHGDQLNKWS